MLDFVTKNEDGSFKPYIVKAREAIANSSPESSVYIGCDSLRIKTSKSKTGWAIKYSQVIILHVNSNNGGKLYHETAIIEDVTGKYGDKAALRERLMGEVYRAVELVESIIDVIGDRRLEVHLDINSDPTQKSHAVVTEALGYVKAMTGYDAVIKTPNGDSWASTHAADNLVRR